MNGESCVFPEGEFIWGVQRCGAEAVTVVRDDWGDEGPVCAEHAEAIAKEATR